MVPVGADYRVKWARSSSARRKQWVRRILKNQAHKLKFNLPIFWFNVVKMLILQD